MKPLAIILPVLLTLATAKNETQKSHQFDIYIFTLHWPYTTCFDWMEHGKGHKCSKIGSPTWSVHGLWPTRYGQIAPNFCNKSWEYNHDLMGPIMSDMNMFWPDVELRDTPDSLWQHEWTKHGTCATLPENNTTMSSQLEYFRTGCRLAQDNPAVTWLSDHNVVPSDSVQYTTKQVWDAVVTGTGGYRPHIDCIKIEGEAYITEIKVCYDKSLQRVNCDHIVSLARADNSADNMMGTCLKYDSFTYPATSSPDTDNGSSGVVVGVVCSVLGIGGLIVGAGYYFAKKYTRRGRGYESL